ncbi:glutamate synthase (ferredoxin) [Anopheles sinensis]|uniref:Glutamate synthase (Ferredoxin) n=1 Tax=Anopheles sinensis TaxID=74873 RepID=A0A084WTB5_ANOSI|nr:glutamate synthase (ferredoxin) [Anopheles sinensis]
MPPHIHPNYRALSSRETRDQMGPFFRPTLPVAENCGTHRKHSPVCVRAGPPVGFGQPVPARTSVSPIPQHNMQIFILKRLIGKRAPDRMHHGRNGRCHLKAARTATTDASDVRRKLSVRFFLRVTLFSHPFYSGLVNQWAGPAGLPVGNGNRRNVRTAFDENGDAPAQLDCT